MVYLCMAILGMFVVYLVLSMVIDALVHIGSLDYRSILDADTEWLRSTRTTIKSNQLTWRHWMLTLIWLVQFHSLKF